MPSYVRYGGQRSSRPLVPLALTVGLPRHVGSAVSRGDARDGMLAHWHARALRHRLATYPPGQAVPPLVRRIPSPDAATWRQETRTREPHPLIRLPGGGINEPGVTSPRLSVAPPLARSSASRMQRSVDMKTTEQTRPAVAGHREARGAREQIAHILLQSRSSHKPCRQGTTHKPRRRFRNCSLSHTLAPRAPGSMGRCLRLRRQATYRRDDGALSTGVQRTRAPVDLATCASRLRVDAGCVSRAIDRLTSALGAHVRHRERCPRDSPQPLTRLAATPAGSREPRGPAPR